MSEDSVASVSKILSSIDQGDPKAASELLPILYDELRRLAAQKLAHERPGQTLQATALVHEAYIRLVGSNEDGQNWNGKGHFFGAAAEAMRRILVENSRRKGSQKRGGGYKRVPLHDAESLSETEPDSFLALDEALIKLAELDEVNANLVKLHFFAGLQFKEAAVLLDISERTAKRRWAFVRSWLQLEMQKSLSGEPDVE
ncbi:MAG: RNA polymerase sigma factor (TIGR02999 family) [Verrucomicrobiales bacterium]|jgi:RNA polymerase sigma factor (TIGR02999 family)